MDGMPDQWEVWEAQRHQVELAIDNLGDAGHLLIERTTKSRERDQLKGEFQERVNQTAKGLHAMEAVIEDAWNLSRRTLVVKEQQHHE